MKIKQIKTKMAAVALSTMMITSIITCPSVIQPVSAINTPTSTNAVADVTFTANIKNEVNGVVTDIPCEFKVTKPASNGGKGEVQVGNGVIPAINTTTTGTITIPETVGYGTDEYTVTSIGDGAFNGCMSLENTGLESNSTVTSIGNSAFYGCQSLQNTGLESNSTVISIGEYAFGSCTSLQSTGLESNSTVTSIGARAFVICSGLTSTGLESNSTVTSIGSEVFYGCTSLKSTGLESNSTVKSIGDKAFWGCTSLQSTGLESNKTVTSIGNGAFFNCTSLKSTGLENNKTVTSVGRGAFFNCTGLEKVSFKITTLPTMDNSYGGIFGGTNVNVYYLPETTNPEQLTDCGAASVTKLIIQNATMNTKPKDIYVASQTFDPTGLVLNVAYDQGVTREVAYNDTTKANFSFDKTLLVAGDKEVKITYLGKEVSLPITVTSQEKVKTNDSTSDINGIVLSLLVTGILGVVLIKRKRDIVE